ncbi:MAG: arylsulfatase [Spirosomataceae bacterium]|jgi:arylsulfatase A
MKKLPLFFIATCFLTISCTEKTTHKQPNVIYILADDLGYGDVSANNPEGKIITPNIDALADEGIRFTDAHSGSAVCTPTRYGIMTGRYSWRGVLKKGVTWSYDSSIVETDRLTVADLFQQNGYKTACIGKWHLGLNWSKEDTLDYPVDFRKAVGKSPNTNGFDYSYIIPASLDIPPYVYVENGSVTEHPNRQTIDESKFGWWRLGPTGSDFVHENVLQRFADKTVEFINQQTDEPFFVYMPLAAPHTPILPSEKFRGKSGLNEYGDFVLMVDDVVGQVRDALKAKGLDENTLIIFTSDNGCAPYADVTNLEAKGHFASGPFRGYKADIFEGGHRVPFIVKWANEISAGSVSDETICLTDFMHTAASVLGVDLPETVAEDSYDLSKIWNGELPEGTSLREVTIHHSVNGTFAIRRGDWKLILSPDSGGWSEPRPERMKGKTGVQLYNLVTDIGEKTNVAEQNPEIVSQLKAALKSNIEAGRSTAGAKQAYVNPTDWNILSRL